MRLVPPLLASLTLSSVAAAEPATSPYAVGVRIGGYGFRREGDPSTTGWTQCRMNGAGVFANRDLHGPLFVEAGLDAYTSTNQGAPTDLPIDRQSGLVSLAAGVRTNLTPWLRGYIQLGAGVELTRVAVPYGDAGTIRDDKLLPDGFFGFGGDLRIARGTYLGASMRTLVMGNFDYDPARLQMANPWVAAPRAADVFSASPGLAAQGQFYLRHDL
jgi:hypothetical protein